MTEHSTNIDPKKDVKVREISVGNGKITYIDIFPAIQKWIDKGISATTLYSILSHALDDYNTGTITSNHKSFKDIKAVFSSMNATGLTNTTSKSFLIPTDFEFDRVEIKAGLTTLDLSNVTIMKVSDYNLGNAYAHDLSVHDGNGQYTNTYFNTESSPVNLIFKPSATVNVSSADKIINIRNVSAISLFDDRIFHLSIRDPSVYINGVTRFDQF